jgi:hypothetical protein
MDSFVLDVTPIHKETVEEIHASTISAGEAKLSPLKMHETIDRSRANTGQSYDSNLPPTPAHPFFSGNESDGYSDGSIVFNSPAKQSQTGSYQQPHQLKPAASDSKIRQDRFPSFDSAGSSGSVVKKVVPPMRSVNVAPNPKILPYHERRKLMQLRQSQQEAAAAAAAAQMQQHHHHHQHHHARDQTPPRPEMPPPPQQRPQFMPPHPSFLMTQHGAPQPPPGYYNANNSQPAPSNSYMPFPPSHAQQPPHFGMMMMPPPPPPSSNYAFPPGVMMHPMAPFPPNSDYRPDNRQFEQYPHPPLQNLPPSFDRAERPHGNHSLTVEPMPSSAHASANMVTPPQHTQPLMDNSPSSRPPPQQRLPPYRRVSGQSADGGDQFLTSSSYDSSDCVDFPQSVSLGVGVSGRSSKEAAPPPPPPPPTPPPPETPHPSSLLIRQDSLGSVSSLGSLDRSGRDNASRTNPSFFDRFNPWASPPKEPNVSDFHRKNQAFLTKMERIQGLSSPSPHQIAKRCVTCEPDRNRWDAHLTPTLSLLPR